MHFPIYELTSERLDRADWMDEFTFVDDPLVQCFTDYTQEIEEEDRENYLSRLPELFAGLAEVDLEKGEVRFESREKIEQVLNSYYRGIVDEMENTKSVGWLRFYQIRRYGYWYLDSEVIFYVNGCTLSSMQFVEDCYHYAGQTLYIGGVIDAHV